MNEVAVLDVFLIFNRCMTTWQLGEMVSKLLHDQESADVWIVRDISGLELLMKKQNHGVTRSLKSSRNSMKDSVIMAGGITFLSVQDFNFTVA